MTRRGEAVDRALHVGANRVDVVLGEAEVENGAHARDVDGFDEQHRRRKVVHRRLHRGVRRVTAVCCALDHVASGLVPHRRRVSAVQSGVSPEKRGPNVRTAPSHAVGQRFSVRGRRFDVRRRRIDLDRGAFDLGRGAFDLGRGAIDFGHCTSTGVLAHWIRSDVEGSRASITRARNETVWMNVARRPFKCGAASACVTARSTPDVGDPTSDFGTCMPPDTTWVSAGLRTISGAARSPSQSPVAGSGAPTTCPALLLAFRRENHCCHSSRYV